MTTLNVPVTKAKATIDVTLDAMPDRIYQAALAEGFKVLVNGGSSKINKEAYPDPEELKAAAMAKAQERVDQMIADKLIIRGAAKAKSGKFGEHSSAVVTEARRIAKDMVKKSIRAAGQKVTSYAASEITAAANSILEDASETSAAPGIFAMAEKNLAERGKLTVPSLDVSVMKQKPKEDHPPLSAIQAGKVAPHAPHAHTAH